MPRGWASPTATAAPYSPGVFSSDRDTGLTLATTRAPTSATFAAKASQRSRQPR